MNPNELSDSLNRLDAIRRTDAGLYAVALHAFIEARASRQVGSTRELSFREVLQTWYRDHRDSFPGLAGGTDIEILEGE